MSADRDLLARVTEHAAANAILPSPSPPPPTGLHRHLMGEFPAVQPWIPPMLQRCLAQHIQRGWPTRRPECRGRSFENQSHSPRRDHPGRPAPNDQPTRPPPPGSVDPLQHAINCEL